MTIKINIKVSHLIIVILLLGSLLGAGAALAGNPDLPGAPTATNSTQQGHKCNFFTRVES